MSFFQCVCVARIAGQRDKKISHIIITLIACKLSRKNIVPSGTCHFWVSRTYSKQVAGWLKWLKTVPRTTSDYAVYWVYFDCNISKQDLLLIIIGTFIIIKRVRNLHAARLRGPKSNRSSGILRARKSP